MDRWAVIRQAAGHLLEDLERRTGTAAFTPESGSHARIPEIACSCLDLKVAPDPLLDTRQIGFLRSDSGITYWPGLPPERLAFLIAHLLGHHVLGHPPRPEPEESEDVDDQPAFSMLQGKDGASSSSPAFLSRDRCELEANVFAAELLAPVHRLRQITLENPEWSLRELAAYFGLSPEAVANQLVAALLPGPAEEEEVATAPLPALDSAQRAAAVVDGAALVVAGPGAGKTRVLTERYRYLVQESGVEPQHLLALTFANRAAEEMRVRLAQMLPEHAAAIQVSTFHSLGMQLLSRFGQGIGLPARFRVASDIDSFVLLRSRLARLDLGHFEDLGAPTRNLRILLEAIGKAKNELMGPEEYADQVQRWRYELENLPDPVHKDDIADRRRQKELIERFEDVARVYRQYQEWLRQEGLLDYGDLLLESVRLFENDVLAAEIRDQYRHLLVDEFQDINYASGRLVREIDGGRNVTWAVGDPRQSIFRFQGASLRNLSQFRSDFPESQIIPLANNYRSVEDIVAAGQAVTFPGSNGKQSQEIFPTALTAVRGKPNQEPAVHLARADTLREEHRWTADEIKALKERGTPLGDVAILCRRRDQAQALSDFLEAEGVPTNWSGILQRNPLFKDVLAILAFAADDPKALVRLAAIPEHALDEADLRLLLRAAEKSQSLVYALSRVEAGELPGLSEVGSKRAMELLALRSALCQRPTPWAMLAAYLFELSRWPRAVFHDNSPEGMRIRTTLGQIADLVRGFRGRGGVAGGQGAREFLRYVALAIESGRLETNSPPPRLSEAVHILTLHSSKGLQWPVVFLPHLVEDTWKADTGELPLPRFLPRERDPLDSDETEEACLVYVGLTRARDRLLISSSRQTRFGNRDAALHPLIVGVRKKLELQDRIQATVLESSLPEETRPAATEDVKPPPTHLPFRFGSVSTAIPHRLLEMHSECGLKFLYYYVYRLDDGENQFRLFGRVVRQVMQRIALAVEGGAALSDEEIQEEFLQLWEKVTGGRSEDTLLFIERGVQALLAFRSRLRVGETVTIGREFSFFVEGRRISLKVDELQHDGTRWVVRKHHLSRPSTRHAKDRFFLGLQLANEGSNLRSPQVLLDYPLEKRVEFVSPPYGDRVAAHKAQLATTIAAAEAGHFPALPSSFKCRSCAFYLICPAA